VTYHPRIDDECATCMSGTIGFGTANPCQHSAIVKSERPTPCRLQTIEMNCDAAEAARQLLLVVFESSIEIERRGTTSTGATGRRTAAASGTHANLFAAELGLGDQRQILSDDGSAIEYETLRVAVCVLAADHCPIWHTNVPAIDLI